MTQAQVAAIPIQPISREEQEHPKARSKANQLSAGYRFPFALIHTVGDSRTLAKIQARSQNQKPSGSLTEPDGFLSLFSASPCFPHGAGRDLSYLELPAARN